MRPSLRGIDLTEGPLVRNLAAMAWPVILSYLLHTLYSLVDAFWLGKLGKSALVAPTITMHIFFIGLSLAMGLGMGGGTLVSQYMGARRPAAMRRAGGQTLLLLLVTGVLFLLVGQVLATPVLRLLETPSDAFRPTLDYMRWILAGMPFLFVFFVYQSISAAVGDTLSPLKVNAAAVLVNALLDPVLIFGLGPFPYMGVVGAALATTLSQVLAAGLSLQPLLRGTRGMRLHGSDLRWNRSMAGRILRIGAPMSLGQVSTALGFTLLIGIVNTFGSAVTAAFGIGHRIIHLALAPAIGFSQASATAVGQNLGADRIPRASRSVYASSLILGAVLLPITASTFFFGAQISRLFIADPDVIRYGRDLFQITSVSVFAFGFVTVFLGAFRGAGHTVPVMALNIGRLWVLRIPAAYLLAKTLRLGPVGIWWAMFLSNSVIAVAGFLWFLMGTWKRKVIEPMAAVPGTVTDAASPAAPGTTSDAASPDGSGGAPDTASRAAQAASDR